MRLTELLRFELAGAGFIEALTFGLCAEREAFSYLKKANDGKTVVKMSNPMDENNEIVRPNLLPGLLKTIACNREVGVSKGKMINIICFILFNIINFLSFPL
jgi:phenylalanyl-tRNA synthetase beta chain